MESLISEQNFHFRTELPFQNRTSISEQNFHFSFVTIFVPGVEPGSIVVTNKAIDGFHREYHEQVRNNHFGSTFHSHFFVTSHSHFFCYISFTLFLLHLIHTFFATSHSHFFCYISFTLFLLHLIHTFLLH